MTKENAKILNDLFGKAFDLDRELAKQGLSYGSLYEIEQPQNPRGGMTPPPQK